MNQPSLLTALEPIDPRTLVDRIPGVDAPCMCEPGRITVHGARDRTGQSIEALRKRPGYDHSTDTVPAPCGWPFCGWKTHLREDT